MRNKAFLTVVILTAIVGLASVANAQIQFIGVGSSAMLMIHPARTSGKRVFGSAVAANSGPSRVTRSQ